MNDIVHDISFGIGQKNRKKIDHELFDDPAWQLNPLTSLKSLAAEQLGTVGGGNHYVDIFADEHGSYLGRGAFRFPRFGT